MAIDGLRRSRGTTEIRGYFLANRSLPWWAVGLSVMATQLSAVTMIGTTGQGATDGLRFVQFYFGLPLAMVLLGVTLVPFLHGAKVYTAYEYLERRFDPALPDWSLVEALLADGRALEGAEVIVILENFAHVLQQVVTETAVRHVVVTGLGDLLGNPAALAVAQSNARRLGLPVRMHAEQRSHSGGARVAVDHHLRAGKLGEGRRPHGTASRGRRRAAARQRCKTPGAGPPSGLEPLALLGRGVA